MSRACGDRPSKRILTLLIAALMSPLAAHALDLDVKVEPGLALSLTKPQSDRFGLGGAGTLKGLAGFEGSYFNVAAGLTFLGLSSKSGYSSDSMGTAWAPSLGLRIQSPRESELMRLQNPHPEESYYGARPWLDADLLYVRTGSLDRAGFAAAIGASFPIGEARSFWLGPFVRYLQIFQAGRAGYDTSDARTLILGVSLETGTRLVRPTVAQPIVEKAPPAPVAAVPCALRPDRDRDGVPDDVDACPDMAGPPSNVGCPVYEKIIVKKDRFELKEKIHFRQNVSEIDPISHALLDEVAKALNDNKGFRVAIEGHASSEGTEERNLTLSEQRAQAVLDYLAMRGVARDRLVSKGSSSSIPLQSNDTEAGREANRRVDFILHFIILNEGNVK